MRNQHNCLIWMCLRKAFNCNADALLQFLEAFAARWRDRCILFPFAQALAIFWATFQGFSSTQTFPCPKITFAEVIDLFYIETMARSYRQCCVVSTL